MILSLVSLSSDTDSRTVNMATLTVWGLGISQYYVHEKTILNSVTTNKHLVESESRVPMHPYDVFF